MWENVIAEGEKDNELRSDSKRLCVSRMIDSTAAYVAVHHRDSLRFATTVEPDTTVLVVLNRAGTLSSFRFNKTPRVLCL